jgi:Phosphatidylethanolamine-binding protein
MFARLGKFLKRILGNVLYWIGWGVAVLAIVQAIILSVTVCNPLVPLLLGGVGVIVWLIAIGFKFILAPSEEFSTERIRFWLPVILLAAVVVPVVYFVFLQRPDALSVRFTWVGIPACASTSPAFELGGVPAGTKSLSFTMTDLNVPTFHHGGSTIAYTGDAVSRGAISYTGPCPPSGEHDNYRWTVQALDAAGKVLGTGSADAMFPP